MRRRGWMSFPRERSRLRQALHRDRSSVPAMICSSEPPPSLLEPIRQLRKKTSARLWPSSRASKPGLAGIALPEPALVLGKPTSFNHSSLKLPLGHLPVRCLSGDNFWAAVAVAIFMLPARRLRVEILNKMSEGWDGVRNNSPRQECGRSGKARPSKGHLAPPLSHHCSSLETAWALVGRGCFAAALRMLLMTVFVGGDIGPDGWRGEC